MANYALVTAAGRSRRMGGANKLLEPIDGAPMIRRTVEQVCASKAGAVLVVTGRDADAIGAEGGGERFDGHDAMSPCACYGPAKPSGVAPC